MEELFTAVRDACSDETWSRGVRISRSGAVTGESTGEDEIVLRIDTRQGMFCPRVVLYLDDDEWECDCPSRLDACEHVAAAVIALKQARQEGKELPGTDKEPGTISYHFSRIDTHLHFERGVREGDTFHVIESTLDAVASGRVKGPRFMATRADLNADIALGTRRRGILERQAVPKLFAALSRCKDILLDDRPVQVSTREVLPVAILEEYGEGFRLTLIDDPQVTERFDNGVVLRDNVLRPVGVPELTGRELHELPQGKIFNAGAVAELVAEVLPSLQKRIPVHIRTDRLPEPTRERPRIVVETEREGNTLSVLASLVYGDPPVARVESGLLTLLEDRVPIRDVARERKLLQHLGRSLKIAPGIRERFEGEAAVAFTARLEQWRGGISGEGHRAFRVAPPLLPHLRIDGDDFELEFRVADRETAVRGPSPSSVIRAWQTGMSMVPLPDGGWSPLPRNWLEKFGGRIADLLAARTPAGELPPCSVGDLARLCELLDEPPPPAFDRLRAVLEDFAGIPDAELPEDLNAQLRPYQHQGVRWLHFLRTAGLGAMLADDMGLGKTLQALCAIQGRTLVVAPTSVVHNWLDEARRFRPSLGLCKYHGPRRKLDPDAELTITSYALLRMDQEELASVDWDTIVLDEAQQIKNPESQVAQAAYTLQGKFRISLSGTPVENRLDELWSQFHFINRGLLGGMSDFQERYARPILDGDETAAATLRERIRPFLLRRLKREVAPELPKRSDAIIHCELTEGEREIYDAIRAATLEEVLQKLRAGGSVMAAFEALLRLRQAACHVSLVPGQSAESSAKTELLMTCLESAAADGHKALVFSQWTSMLDLIEPHLREAKIDFLRLDGSTRDRGAVVDGFQAEAGPPVLLLSLKAGGTGLNLTAADHVFLMDPWWNPAVEEQAADRAHRIGQDRPVLVYRLVAEETVEERILALQERKREIAEVATGEGVGAGTGITREELVALLE
jgi:superfamily II DNA or RNA helicase